MTSANAQSTVEPTFVRNVAEPPSEPQSYATEDYVLTNGVMVGTDDLHDLQSEAESLVLQDSPRLQKYLTRKTEPSASQQESDASFHPKMLLQRPSTSSLNTSKPEDFNFHVAPVKSQVFTTRSSRNQMVDFAPISTAGTMPARDKGAMAKTVPDLSVA